MWGIWDHMCVPWAPFLFPHPTPSVSQKRGLELIVASYRTPLCRSLPRHTLADRNSYGSDREASVCSICLWIKTQNRGLNVSTSNFTVYPTLRCTWKQKDHDNPLTSFLRSCLNYFDENSLHVICILQTTYFWHFILIGAKRFGIELWLGVNVEVARHGWCNSVFESRISNTQFRCSFAIFVSDSHIQLLWTWDYSVVQRFEYVHISFIPYVLFILFWPDVLC